MAHYDDALVVRFADAGRVRIFFTRTYGNGEAADDVAYGRIGAPAAFESYCRPPLIASSPQASRDHGTAAPSGQYRLIQFAIRLSVRF